jgi:hypothetical protein
MRSASNTQTRRGFLGALRALPLVSLLIPAAVAQGTPQPQPQPQPQPPQPQPSPPSSGPTPSSAPAPQTTPSTPQFQSFEQFANFVQPDVQSDIESHLQDIESATHSNLQNMVGQQLPAGYSGSYISPAQESGPREATEYELEVPSPEDDPMRYTSEAAESQQSLWESGWSSESY